MFDHVLLRVSDRAAAERFYSAVLEPWHVAAFRPLPAITRWENLGITQADDAHPGTRGLHVGFVAPSREQVDAFWQAGIRAGYPDAGAPGPRPRYGEDYYGGFLSDPDGNSVEAVHDGGLASSGLIDHLWIRAADLPAARRFYDTVAPHTGFRLATDTDDRAGFRGDSGSFSVLAGTATEQLHVGFSAPDAATVRAFHADAIAAGYRDNGPPGRRPQYGKRYYGAFVLDPGGNNVEVLHRSA